MSITRFTSKDPVEVVLVTFDFLNLFADQNEHIISADWSVETVVGVDPSPALLLEGLASFSGSTTSRLIKAGIHGCGYHVHAVVTTNLNQVLKLTGFMNVERQ